MGARQSRQSVNITTTVAGSTSALNATTAASVTDPKSATEATETATSSANDQPQPLISNESPEDIKNIVSETGVSGPGKIEPIPEIDVMPQPVENAADAATATEEAASAASAAVPADTSVTESNQDQSQLSESNVTSPTRGDGDSALAKKTKKLKKKWSFKNLSFSRKKKVLNDSAAESQQQQNGGDSSTSSSKVDEVAASERDNQLLNNSTASAEIVTTSDATETTSSDVIAGETAAAAAAANNVTVQETIVEEDAAAAAVVAATVVATTTTAAAAAAAADDDVIIEEKPLPAVETETVANVEEPQSPSVAATITLDASEVTVATTTTDVSLNEKMKNLTINDHENTNGSSAVCFAEQTGEVEATVQSDAEQATNESDVHRANGTMAEEEPAMVTTNGGEIVSEAEPEGVVDDESGERCALNGDSKGHVTNGVNGSADADVAAAADVAMTNGNGGDSESVPVAGNGDFVATDDKEVLEVGKDDIAVLKSVQKQVMEEKTQDLLDVDENGLEHTIATEITNGFSETAAAPALVNE